MMENVALEFFELECYKSINHASGNGNTAWHVSLRRPTPPAVVYLKIRGLTAKSDWEDWDWFAQETWGEQCTGISNIQLICCDITTNTSLGMVLHLTSCVKEPRCHTDTDFNVEVLISNDQPSLVIRSKPVLLDSSKYMGVSCTCSSLSQPAKLVL